MTGNLCQLAACGFPLCLCVHKEERFGSQQRHGTWQWGGHHTQVEQHLCGERRGSDLPTCEREASGTLSHRVRANVSAGLRVADARMESHRGHTAVHPVGVLGACRSSKGGWACSVSSLPEPTRIYGRIQGALVHRYAPALNAAQTARAFCQSRSEPNLWQVRQVRGASGSSVRDMEQVPEPGQRAGLPRRYGERSALPQTSVA